MRKKNSNKLYDERFFTKLIADFKELKRKLKGTNDMKKIRQKLNRVDLVQDVIKMLNLTRGKKSLGYFTKSQLLEMKIIISSLQERSEITESKTSDSDEELLCSSMSKNNTSRDNHED